MGFFDSFKEPDVAKMLANKDVSGLIKALGHKQASIREKAADSLNNLDLKGVDAAGRKMLRDFYFGAARECSRSGNVAFEIDYYTKSIEAAPSVEAFFNRGNAYYSKGERAKAIADYTNAIEMDPKYSPAYNNRALIYVQREDALSALRDFEKVFELTPASQAGQKAKENIPKLQSILDAKKRDEELRRDVLDRVKVDRHGTVSVSLSIDEYKKLTGR